MRAVARGKSKHLDTGISLSLILFHQDRLLELTEEIGARLEYFQELEHATRMLNHPGESLVLQTDFLYMVERVDICIDYLKAHVSRCVSCYDATLTEYFQRYYREAEIYLLRFQQCMTRAMTLIRMFFVGSLRALTADVSRRLSEKVNSFIAYNQSLDTAIFRMYHPQHKCICFTPGSAVSLLSFLLCSAS